jgi:hypothetical protein
MLQLKNSTPFEAELLPVPDREGIDTVFVVVKGTFGLAQSLTVAEEQVPVALADTHYGDPAKSSVRVPSDFCLDKPGTDVLLIGSAWAPGGRAAWQADVSVSVGPVTKTVRVFGDRAWTSGAGGASMSWIAPFVRMPLVWERAFGGVDQTNKGPTAEARNPVGTGFRSPSGMKPLDGLPLPNLEDPQALISSWSDAPPPAGFAPIAANWQPRLSFAGTYDGAWEKGRAPYLPTDFDPRFFHVAPPGLSTSTPLRGDEWVDVRGATPQGVLQVQLPGVHLDVTFRLDSGTESRPASLDTVILEPDAGRVVLVWRAWLRCDKQIRKVKEVEPRLQGR